MIQENPEKTGILFSILQNKMMINDDKIFEVMANETNNYYHMQTGRPLRTTKKRNKSVSWHFITN